MARRLLSRQGGFVHDINTVASLSDEPNNIRLLSDRSLYILQNLSQEDITFLSRYGEILTGDFYLPVLAGSSEESDVEDAIDLIRRDLNSMGVEELLECLCTQISILAEQAGLDGQGVNPPSSDGDVPVGPGEQFPDQETYFDAKCRVANGIYDTIRGMIDWLENNNAEMIIGGFGGITAAISLALLFAGPVGWAAIAVESTLVSISAWAFSQLFDFEDMQLQFDDVKDELVMALYNASDSVTAEANFLAIYATATPTPTTAEKKLIGYALTSAVLNQLFTPREDVAAYESPDPTDCGAMGLQTWSFEASGEGWVFEDISTGTLEATGEWVSAREAWEITLDMTSGSGSLCGGAIVKDGLAIDVDVGNSVQLDFSAPSDAPTASNQRIRVTYSDLTETFVTGNYTTAGTIIANIPSAKTISEIECAAAREYHPSYNYTIDLEEVRVQ